MKRYLLSIAAAAAGLVAFAPGAFAHGGQFRGPVGGIPNGPREPSDPTPPPPPDPTTPPPPTTPSDPTTPTPPPSTPTTPTTPVAPPTTNGELPTSGGKKTPPSLDQWQFWWGYNNDDILNIKDSIYSIKRTQQGVISDVGGATGARSDSTRATAKQVHDVLIPALLRIIQDPDHKLDPGPDTASAAYIALAKVSDDPSHIQVLMDAIVDKNGKKNSAVHQTVNESAAIALGLLRRTDAKLQLDRKDLDRVRDFLFSVYENNDLQMRTRGFAMIALGLLADQPTGRTRTPTSGGGGLFYTPDTSSMNQVTIDRIVDELRHSYKDPQMYVVALLALGMQQPTDVTKDILEMLKECALKGKLFKEPCDDLVSSYAALAIGKLGGESEIGSMLNALTINQTQSNTKRSAAIALGLLGRRIDGPARGTLAAQIVQALEKVKEMTTKNFGIISLAYLLQADAEAQHTDVLNAKGVKLADYFLKLARDGRYSERPYGALALGLIGRSIGEKPSIVEYGEFRMHSIEALRDGLKETKMDRRSRGAFAIALGMLQDEGSKAELKALVADKSEDKELRGYSAVALGLIGIPDPDVVKVIKDALRERSSEELRQQTAIALGLLQSPDTVPTLLKEMQEADSQNVLGQVVLALAKIGDSRAIQPLVDILNDTSRPDLTRALACAGLGLIGDLERIPSFARLSKDINYRASPDCVNEALSIL